MNQLNWLGTLHQGRSTARLAVLWKVRNNLSTLALLVANFNPSRTVNVEATTNSSRNSSAELNTDRSHTSPEPLILSWRTCCWVSFSPDVTSTQPNNRCRHSYFDTFQKSRSVILGVTRHSNVRTNRTNWF